jgi:hypothetical protein
MDASARPTTRDGPTTPARTSARALDGVEAPVARNAFQLVLAAILEPQSRACDEVPDGARHEHFSGSCLCRDPCADVDCDPGDLAVDELALARVKAGANLEAERIARAVARTALQARAWANAVCPGVACVSLVPESVECGRIDDLTGEVGAVSREPLDHESVVGDLRMRGD